MPSTSSKDTTLNEIIFPNIFSKKMSKHLYDYLEIKIVLGGALKAFKPSFIVDFNFFM